MASSRSGGRLYCEARFDKGAGLGTRLFPWARCKVFSRLHGIPMLAPQWIQFRVGPLLRGGIDLSVYHRQILLLGLFRRNGYIRGVERTLSTLGARRIGEPSDLRSLDRPHGADPVIVSFRGCGGLFGDFAGHRELILRELRAEAYPRWVALADGFATPIAINVRCARDFDDAKRPAEYYTRGALRTPLDWFVHALQFIRAVAGRTLPAVVVSDGTAARLRPLLELPAVRFARPGCAISDLLTLANAKLLIGSGGSSFSAWAAYLSGALTITHPGQSLQWFKVGTSGDQFVDELDPGKPSPSLIDAVRRALSNDRITAVS